MLTSYGDMIVNEPRTPAYAAALRQAITPGCKVIDIGAGPGLFALLACKFGAGEVVAIEPHDSVLLLNEAARANGFDDRITVVHDLSSTYSSSQRADVIISDLRGILPLFEGHIPAIVDARERLLAQGGTLIPARDVLHVALVDHDETRVQFDKPWIDNKFELDLSVGHVFAVNRFIKVTLTREDLLSDPSHLLTLDYQTIMDPSVATTTRLTVSRDGNAHGFVVWFDCELAAGEGFSNAPGEPEQVYGQCFFPFEQSIDVSAGDELTIAIRADHLAGSYIWSWNTTATRAAHEIPLSYRQSTFRGTIISPTRLAALSPSHVPAVMAEHEMDIFCLSQFDGETSLKKIAGRLVLEFPKQFADEAGAFAHASRVAQRYKGAWADHGEDVRT